MFIAEVAKAIQAIEGFEKSKRPLIEGIVMRDGSASLASNQDGAVVEAKSQTSVPIDAATNGASIENSNREDNLINARNESSTPIFRESLSKKKPLVGRNRENFEKILRSRPLKLARNFEAQEAQNELRETKNQTFFGDSDLEESDDMEAVGTVGAAPKAAILKLPRKSRAPAEQRVRSESVDRPKQEKTPSVGAKIERRNRGINLYTECHVTPEPKHGKNWRLGTSSRSEKDAASISQRSLSAKRIGRADPRGQPSTSDERPAGDRQGKRRVAGERQRERACTNEPGQPDLCSISLEAISAISRSDAPELMAGKRFARFCPISLGGSSCYALLDSGNLLTNAISTQAARTMGIKRKDIEPIEGMATVGTAKTGASLRVRGIVREPLSLTFGSCPVKYQIRPIVCDGLTMPVNIAGPFMREIGLDQLHSQDAIKVANHKVYLLKPKGCGARQSGVFTVGNIKIPPYSAKFVPTKIREQEGGRMYPHSEGVVIAHPDFAIQTDVVPCIKSCVSVQPGGLTEVLCLNTAGYEMEVPEGR